MAMASRSTLFAFSTIISLWRPIFIFCLISLIFPIGHFFIDDFMKVHTSFSTLQAAANVLTFVLVIIMIGLCIGYWIIEKQIKQWNMQKQYEKKIPYEKTLRYIKVLTLTPIPMAAIVTRYAMIMFERKIQIHYAMALIQTAGAYFMLKRVINEETEKILDTHNACKVQAIGGAVNSIVLYVITYGKTFHEDMMVTIANIVLLASIHGWLIVSESGCRRVKNGRYLQKNMYTMCGSIVFTYALFKRILRPEWASSVIDIILATCLTLLFWHAGYQWVTREKNLSQSPNATMIQDLLDILTMMAAASAGSLGVPFFFLRVLVLFSIIYIAIIKSYFNISGTFDFIYAAILLLSSVVYFLWTKMGFLDVQFRTLALPFWQTISLQHVNIMIVIMILFAITLTWAYSHNLYSTWTHYVFAAYSCMLAVVESLLVSQKDLYPRFLIVLTSFAGSIVLKRLEHTMPDFVGSICLVIFIAKLGMLFSDDLFDFLSCTMFTYVILRSRVSHTGYDFQTIARHCVLCIFVLLSLRSSVLQHVFMALGIYNPSVSLSASVLLILGVLISAPFASLSFRQLLTVLSTLLMFVLTLILLADVFSHIEFSTLSLAVFIISSALLFSHVSGLIPLDPSYAAASTGLTFAALFISTFLPARTIFAVCLLPAAGFTSIVCAPRLLNTSGMLAVSDTAYVWLLLYFCFSYLLSIALYGAMASSFNNIGVLLRSSIITTHAVCHFAIALSSVFMVYSNSVRTSKRAAFIREAMSMSSYTELGNLSAILSFVLACLLSSWYLDGSDLMAALFASVLLLMQESKGILRCLTGIKRYVACMVGLFIYYVFISVQNVFIFHLGNETSMAFPSLILFYFKNVGFLLTSVLAFEHSTRYLWCLSNHQWRHILFLPMHLLALFLADIQAIRLASLCAVIASSCATILYYQILNTYENII